MPNEPYRSLAKRLDNPTRYITIEQLVDTRLSVGSLTPDQCRQLMCQLDDEQIKNAVYDRTLCFPHTQWTQNIRAMYGKQVQHDNERGDLVFDNITTNTESLFAAWRNIYVFEKRDFDNLEVHVKSYLSPSIDNVGVYGTFTDFTKTKTNALAALLQIGQLIVDIPILRSEPGMELFVYDPLSRAGKLPGLDAIGCPTLQHHPLLLPRAYVY